MLVYQSFAYKSETGYSPNAFLPLLLLCLWQQVSFTFKIELELPIRCKVDWVTIRMKNNVVFVLKMDCWPDPQSQSVAASGGSLGLVSMTPHSWSFVYFLACFFPFLCAGFCWISKFWMGCVSAWSFTLFSFWASLIKYWELIKYWSLQFICWPLKVPWSFGLICPTVDR